MQSHSLPVPSDKPRCKDCKMCQMCSENRCASCRATSNGNRVRKLSLKEQVALYDSLNPGLGCGQPHCGRSLKQSE